MTCSYGDPGGTDRDPGQSLYLSRYYGLANKEDRILSTSKFHISERIETKFGGHLPFGTDRALGYISKQKNSAFVSVANLL